VPNNILFPIIKKEAKGIILKLKISLIYWKPKFARGIKRYTPKRHRKCGPFRPH
jgi:hypothetical protein